MAREFGARRVVTFAAMASPIHPSAEARVFTVATTAELLDELRRQGVHVLEDGEISGLNGVLLAAALSHRLDGVCLLGEFPYFASHVPNPKASTAVLRAFSLLAGIGIDLDELEAQAEAVESSLTEHLERLQQVASTQVRFPGTPDEETTEEEPSEVALTSEIEARIEALFQAASSDRSKALELKSELDRHGVFGRYEDRFLDLFKRGE